MAYKMKDSVYEMEGELLEFTNYKPKPREVAKRTKTIIERTGGPAKVRLDRVHEEGVFGKSYKCIVVKYPGKLKKFYTMVFVFVENKFNLHFFGSSTDHRIETIRKKREGTKLGRLKNAITKSPDAIINQEQEWSSIVIKTVMGDVLCEMINEETERVIRRKGL